MITSNYINVVNTEHSVCQDKELRIDDCCVGVAYFELKLFVCHFQLIAVYNCDGIRETEIFRQDQNSIIWSMTKSTQNTLVCLLGNESMWSLKVIDIKGCFLKQVFRYNIECNLIPSQCLSSVLADLEGNVYLHNKYVCLKITKTGKVEKFNLSDDEFVDVCYDAKNDMLVFLCSTSPLLISPNSSEETDMYKIGLDNELKITRMHEGNFYILGI